MNQGIYGVGRGDIGNDAVWRKRRPLANDCSRAGCRRWRCGWLGWLVGHNWRRRWRRCSRRADRSRDYRQFRVCNGGAQVGLGPRHLEYAAATAVQVASIALSQLVVAAVACKTPTVHMRVCTRWRQRGERRRSREFEWARLTLLGASITGTGFSGGSTDGYNSGGGGGAGGAGASNGTGGSGKTAAVNGVTYAGGGGGALSGAVQVPAAAARAALPPWQRRRERLTQGAVVAAHTLPPRRLELEALV